MKRLQIEIKKLPNFKGKIGYAHSYDAGCDLTAGIEEPLVIPVGKFKTIPTGVCISVPPGYEAQVRARSGLAFKHGIGIVNGVGTVDSGYTGQIFAILFNIGDADLVVSPGDRICQLVFNEIVQAAFMEVEELAPTPRGEKGFGSTGI